jgi:hypothetical protein
VACRLEQILVKKKVAPVKKGDVEQSPSDVIESAVKRLHRVVVYATEAMALLLHEDIEAGVAPAAMLDVCTHGMVNSMFNGVATGAGARGDTPNHAAQTRVRDAYHRIHGEDAELVDGSGMTQLICSEARRYIATLKTSLARHFCKRVKRYCMERLRLSREQYAALSRDERRAHALRTGRAARAVWLPAWDTGDADARDAQFVRETRAVLGMDSIEWSPRNAAGRPMKRTLLQILNANPLHFLPGMVALNRAFAAAGKRTFRVVPMTCTLTPRFVTIDQRVLKELGFVDAAARKKLAKDAVDRRERVLPFKERIAGLRQGRKEEEDAWKQADIELNIGRPKNEKKRMPSDEEQQRREARRGVLAAAIEVAEQDPEYVALCDGAAAEKRVAFESAFDVAKEGVLSKANAAAWKHSLSTDGVSARLCLEARAEKKTPAAPRGKKRGRGQPDDTREKVGPLPRRGTISVEQLRLHLFGSSAPPTLEDEWKQRLADTPSPHEQNAMLNETIDRLMALNGCGHPRPTFAGGDPGKRELLALSNPDLEWHNRKEMEATFGPDRPPSPSLHPPIVERPRIASDRLSDYYAPQRRQRYTAAQRRGDVTPAQFFLKQRQIDDPVRKERSERASAYWRAYVRKPDDVRAVEQTLCVHCSNGPTAERLLAYLRARSAALATLMPWYTDRQRRQIRWKAFIEEQRSISRFCDRIKRMRLPWGGPLVLAYGGYALSGLGHLKGMPPCMNKGLLKKLSREILIVVVPEHYTSKRCFQCGGECGNHSRLAERDRRAAVNETLDIKRAKRLEQCATPGDRAKVEQWYVSAMARPCEIRGLRFCTGCKRCLNRDANSAPQMAVQLKRLLLGAGTLHRLSAAETELVQLQIETDA